MIFPFQFQSFLNSLKAKRDAKKELPADFGEEMNRWSLESIGCIALDTRLGVLDSSKPNPDAELIIKVN